VRLRPFGSLSPAPKGCVLRRPPLNAAEEDAASMCLQTKTRIFAAGRKAASRRVRAAGKVEAVTQRVSLIQCRPIAEMFASGACMMHP
jgi:hypothetical protein